MEVISGDPVYWNDTKNDVYAFVEPVIWILLMKTLRLTTILAFKKFLDMLDSQISLWYLSLIENGNQKHQNNKFNRIPFSHI